MRYEQFSCNQLTIGQGNGIPAAGAGESSLISVSLTPASVGAATVAAQSLTIPGVKASDVVVCVRHPITNAVGIDVVQATANNTVSARFVNPTAGALTPTAGVYTFLVLKTR